jgi:hypothetical protein
VRLRGGASVRTCAALSAAVSGSHVLKQILVSVAVIIVAVAGYVFLVPGAPQTLARFGVSLPVNHTDRGKAETSRPCSGTGQVPRRRRAWRRSGIGGRHRAGDACHHQRPPVRHR